MKKTFNAGAQLLARGYSKVKNTVDQCATQATVGVGLAVSSAMSFAQAVDPFDTAMTTATTKVTSYAGALVGLSAVAVIFLIAIKYVKRIPKAS